MRVRFIGRIGGGCGYYRILLPMRWLQQHGDNAAENIPVRMNVRTGEVVFTEPPPDILIVQRPLEPHLFDLAMLLRRQGTRVVVELDDLLHESIPAAVPLARELAGAERWRLDVLARSIREADALIVSTPYLRDYYRARTDTPVFVWENHLPQVSRHDERKQAIVYAGSSGHLEDIRGVARAVRRVASRMGWPIVAIGEEHIAAAAAADENIGWIDIDEHPDDYYARLAGAGCIGLHPMYRTKFNMARSFIKPLEYNACGLVPIVSDLPAQREYVDDGVNGFIVRNMHDFARNIEFLTKNPAVIERIIEDGYEYASRHTMEQGGPLYRKILERVLTM